MSEIVAKFTTDEIVRYAEYAAKRITDHYAPGRAACGYMAFCNPADGRPIHLFEIGCNPPEKVARRISFCMEKAQRLAANAHHLSSHQSRKVNPENKDDPGNKWGGAIRARYIVSFSGLPELADEALCVCVADFAGWLEDRSSITIIFDLSGNVGGHKALRRVTS